jgi:formylglycine-generating enzyme required for sulfatase activity
MTTSSALQNALRRVRPVCLFLFSSAVLCPAAQAQSFVKIPAGKFTMGDPTGVVGHDDETLHTLTLSAFYLATTETTYAEWKTVYTWALDHGYTFENGGDGRGAKHPVQRVSWYDVVKWCNAKSEKNGRIPCYRVGADVYRTGNKNPSCNWKVNGYRLPTESEWEKAARGKLAGQNFSWGDTITHSLANYNSTFLRYDVSPTRGYHPTYGAGLFPYTSPVGSFVANGYGLYDMVGNVREWCWDRYATYPLSPVFNPRGGASGSFRVYRGGSSLTDASECRAADRGKGGFFQFTFSPDLGFRLARSSVP